MNNNADKPGELDKNAQATLKDDQGNLQKTSENNLSDGGNGKPAPEDDKLKGSAGPEEKDISD